MSNRYHPTARSLQWGPPAVSLAALYGDELGDNDDVGAAVAVEPRRAITLSGITRNNRIPLRQWINGALNASGSDLAAGASSSYIASSMKIAIHLTKQISQAEDLARFGLFRGLDVLPIGAGVDWAEYVIVCLKTNGQCGVANSRLLRQQEEQQKQGSSFAGNAAARDEDADLKAFLSICGVDEYEGAANGPGSSLYPGAGTLEKTPFYNGGNRGDAPPACKTGEVSYLSVDSAEISCTNEQVSNGHTSEVNTKREALLRIYSLGLVFYELFSGGEEPPHELSALSSSNGAFISLPTLSILDTGHDNQVAYDSKRRQGPSGSSSEIGLCQLSFEYLKLMGLPGPLCNLIFNMLDCIYGDFSGKDCYTRMTDVTSDLQLMIDRPFKFLKDLDIEKLSLSGLQLHETLLPRDEEFASIQSCYRRSVSGSESYELALIVGESGTGKSWLAYHVGRFIAAQGGLFLSGKFDQMMQAKPFSALASAFDQYCEALSREKESDWAQVVVRKLLSALGEDSVEYLIKIIPKLRHIFACKTNEETANDSVFDRDCQQAMQRLRYLLCQFVEVISSVSPVAVTLFLDDVQWADAASISVLNQILMRGHNRFFFLGCCRDDEMKNDHPFSKMTENVGAFGIKTTIVKLHGMKKETLNQMVSDLLCLPPRLVWPLSDIVFNKTKGNPLFFSQLMLELNRDGLLHVSLSRQRWEWDEEEIQSRKLPDDVALCFANGISRLPLEVQAALHTLSCFGASLKCEFIQALESQLSLKLLEPLKIAAAEGLVSKLKGSFSFCHDRIQAATYDLINEEVRLRDHSTYGLCLAKLALESGNDEMLFTAVSQINLGGPSIVSDTQDSITKAKFNLSAGKRAILLSDFSSAYTFFTFGVKFLPDNLWSDYYHLSLELFELSAKCALSIGNLSDLRMLGGEVMKYARCFDDKLNIYFTMISSLAYASKIAEAVEKSCAILSRLGEDMPSNVTKETLGHHIENTQLMIRGLSESDLLNYRLMTDTTKLMSMKFLAKMLGLALMVNPNFHAFVTLKMLQLTISHGLSPVSPIAFCYFGALLAKLGDLRVGYRFTVLAKTLLDKLESQEVAGEVLGVTTEMLCFIEPLQASNELRSQGENAAMASGDFHFACISRLKYCSTLFWSGRSLSDAKDALSRASRFMKEHGHKTCLVFLIPIERTILALVDANKETHISSDNRNPRQLMQLSFHDMFLSFMLHKCNLKKSTEKFFESDRNSWFLFLADTRHALIAGLASFHIYREKRELLWAERGRRCKLDLKLWAEQGSLWNFQHLFLLLDAEEHYSCNDDFDNAKASYNGAIGLAKSHNFIYDEALSYELAANFYLNYGKLVTSLEYFRRAHEKYHEWGARAKADKLFEFTREKFASMIDARGCQILNPLVDSSVLSRHNSDESDTRKRQLQFQN